MSKVHADASAVIQAQPDEVYAVLADYRNEHIHVLPEEYFSDLRVEAGGTGAGTVFRVCTHVMGTQREFHMQVSEPEPGRILQETDLPTGLVTRFVLDPAQGGQYTRLTISSDWESSRGLAGWMDRLFTPRIMRQIYTKQLAKVDAYLQSKRK